MVKTANKITVLCLIIFLSSCASTNLPNPNRGFYEEVRSFAKSYTIAKVSSREQKNGLAEVVSMEFESLNSFIELANSIGVLFNESIVKIRIEGIAMKHNITPDNNLVVKYFILGVSDYVLGT